MTRYRQKPIEVEAWQVGSDEPMPDWLKSAIDDGTAKPYYNGFWWMIMTPRGFRKVNDGHYIVQGARGKLYPCEPDILKRDYEVVE